MIPNHYIEIIYGNENKSSGGSIKYHEISQQLGIAQVFFDDSESKRKSYCHSEVHLECFV